MFKTLAAGPALAAMLLTAAICPAAPPELKEKSPRVEVVFCLDTTGSMTGLIEGAKQKIWSVVNQIASGKPTPEVRVGLVAYRDRGDAYVTQIHDLTTDLDEVHKNLKTFVAAGGGDAPESVNQALNDSVRRIKWSDEKDTLRIVFLVGDAPPHMDYQDDVKYPDTCKLATEKGIIINTIQCGRDRECAKCWKDICAKAGGSYAQIAQDGGVQSHDTPFDAELATINSRLLKTNVCYGTEKEQVAGQLKNASAAALPTGGGLAADSAGFRAKQARVAANDLLDDLKEGKKKLDEIKEAELPEELRKLTKDELAATMKKLQAERDALKKTALELDKKRMDFIAKKSAEDKAKGDQKDGFDSQVLEMLRKQADKANIKY